MDAKHLLAGLERVDQEHVNVSANTVTFNIADPDKGIPGCEDRDIVKFATSMYESVCKDSPRLEEGPRCISALVTAQTWIKFLMHVVRNGKEARHPRAMVRNMYEERRK